MERFKIFLSSLKFRYHITFLEVVLGYLVANGFEFGIKDFLTLTATFFVFCLLLYSGIYLFNDIFDLEKDKNHPRKKFRPLAAGKMEKNEAFIGSFALIGSALAISMFLGFKIAIFAFIFLIFNVFYTIIFKKIPYLEVFANAATHPLRVFFGMALVSSFVAGYPQILFFDFLAALSLSFLKRRNDLEQYIECKKADESFYSAGTIDLLIFLILSLNIYFIFMPNTDISRLIGILAFLAQIFVISGVYFSKSIKKFLYYKIWK